MSWLRRCLAVLAVVMAGVLMPAVARAGGSPEVLAVAGEAARARGVAVSGVVLLAAALCCLGVVALVILTVVLITRGRRTGAR